MPNEKVESIYYRPCDCGEGSLHTHFVGYNVADTVCMLCGQAYMSHQGLQRFCPSPPLYLTRDAREQRQEIINACEQAINQILNSRFCGHSREEHATKAERIQTLLRQRDEMLKELEKKNV